MSILNETEKTLKRLAKSPDVPMQGAWYGACRKKGLDEWNYFVFNRKKTTKSSNRLDFQTFYEVHIVHEDYIPEGYIETVVRALESQSDGAKLKCTSDDIVYDYIFKGNTEMVVEIATITLFHPEKRF